jgi:hypothetical protein
MGLEFLSGIGSVFTGAYDNVATIAGGVWDWATDNPQVVSGIVGAAGGVADYLSAQDAADAKRAESKATEEQIARHNQGIATAAQGYRDKRGLLQGGA